MKKSGVKISVIIPVYNNEKYLRECLDSVVSQTLRETEILCVDDGSTDKSLNILKEYASKDIRLIILTQRNSGSGPARNSGIKIAAGQFVFFMDSDDLLPERDILETLYEHAVKNNVHICGGQFSSFFNDSPNIVTTLFKNNFYGYNFDKNEKIQYSDYQFDYGYARFIYERNFLIQNSIFFQPYRRFQDPPFFAEAMIKAKEFYAVDKISYLYRKFKKRSPWSNVQCEDLVKGILFNLKLSNSYGLPRLHNLTFSRLVAHFDRIGHIHNFYFLFLLFMVFRAYDKKYVEKMPAKKFKLFFYKNIFKTFFSVENVGKSKQITVLGFPMKVKGRSNA